MDLHHVGQSGQACGSQDAGLIGRLPRIAQIEIVLQVMVRANEQEKASAGG
jgi:hypothetical protein